MDINFYTMPLPKYRVGQKILIRQSDEYDKTSLTHGIILFPNITDNTYTVKIDATGGIDKVNETDIVHCDEFSPAQLRRPNIRIIFFGNGPFAVPTLRMLYEMGYDIAAVVTTPDKPKGRGRIIYPSDVKICATEMGLDILQPENLSDPKFLLYIKGLGATLGVVVDFRIMPESLYSIPKYGTINLHCSLLPTFRGASPIATAVREGYSVFGVTVFRLDDKIDNGDIILNCGANMEYTTAGYISSELALLGSRIMDRAILYLLNGYPLIPQEDLCCRLFQPSMTRKISKTDCRIDWNKTAKEIYNHIRAYSSKPGAWTDLLFNSGISSTVRIFSAEPTSIPRGNHKIGTVFSAGKNIYAACSDKLLKIQWLQMPGRKQNHASDFINGMGGEFSATAIN